MATLNEVVACARGLVRFTYTADASAYFRKTNKTRGGMTFAERFPRGVTKRTHVVASLALDQNYEREIMASAMRQGVSPALVTDLVGFTAHGLSGFTWHPDHVGLVVANGAGELALRAYPASGTANYGTESAVYIDNATATELTAADLEPWAGAPKKLYPLTVGGVAMTRADGTPIYKIVPHYYYLSHITDISAM